MTSTAPSIPRPRRADPASTACRYCGRSGAPSTPAGRAHTACAEAVAAHVAAEAARCADDLAARYNAFVIDRRRTPRP
jgi:hypothetical protein